MCGSKGTVMVHLIGKPPRTGLLSCAAGNAGVAESCLAESLGSGHFIKGLGDWLPIIEKSEIEMQIGCEH